MIVDMLALGLLVVVAIALVASAIPLLAALGAYTYTRRTGPVRELWNGYVEYVDDMVKSAERKARSRNRRDRK